MGLFVDMYLSLEVLEQQIHEDGAYFLLFCALVGLLLSTGFPELFE